MPHWFNPANIVAALAAINFAAFAAFGIDKSLAERGQWRIKESTLLRLALLGGTFGAYAGRAVFRHKTRKQPFSGMLHTIAVLQLAALAVWTWWPGESAALVRSGWSALSEAAS